MLSREPFDMFNLIDKMKKVSLFGLQVDPKCLFPMKRMLSLIVILHFEHYQYKTFLNMMIFDKSPYFFRGSAGGEKNQLVFIPL